MSHRLPLFARHIQLYYDVTLIQCEVAVCRKKHYIVIVRNTGLFWFGGPFCTIHKIESRYYCGPPSYSRLNMRSRPASGMNEPVVSFAANSTNLTSLHR